MKIALCFFGQLRSPQETFPTIYENLIKPNGIEDIFIHSWDFSEIKEAPSYDFDHRKYSYTFKNEDIDFINNNFHPKKFKLDDNNIIKTHPNYREFFEHNQTLRQFNLQSGYYSLKEVNNLKNEYKKENNVAYDAVVVMRMDLKILAPIIIKNLDTNILNVSDLYTIPSQGWLTEILSIGNEDIIDKMANLVNKYGDYYNEGVSFHGETLMGHHAYCLQIPCTISFRFFFDHVICGFNKKACLGYE